MLAVVLGGGGVTREGSGQRAARRWLAEWKSPASAERECRTRGTTATPSSPPRPRWTRAKPLDALAEYLPIPPFRPYNGGDSSVGHVYPSRRTHRRGVADPPAGRRRRATQIEEPFLFVQKKLWLGEAVEEAKGKSRRVLRGVPKVLGYWGHMPRSVTAATARTHAGALRCGG